MDLEIVAEFGTNNVDTEGRVLPDMEEYIKVLAKKGATAVKFQFFKADTLVKKTEKVWEIIKRLELPIDEHIKFKRYCDQAGVKYLCTPFCIESLDALLDIGLREIKVASCDCGNVKFLSDILKRKNRIDRIIMSTGMSSLKEIETSMEFLIEGDFKIDLLHCVSLYPAKESQASLGAILVLKRNFGMYCDIGYSDHTLGEESARIARSMGCTIFEKHVTPDRDMAGLDHAYSYPINDFDKYVNAIKTVDLMIGDEKKIILKEEESFRENMKRGIWFNRDVSKDQVITEEDIIVCRPLKGTLNQSSYYSIIEKRISKDIEKDSSVCMSQFY